MNINHIKTYKS